MRKIILNLAISLDGYIASEDGGFDWIVGDGNEALNTEKAFEFNEFLEGIDVVVMGGNSARQGFFNDYEDKKVFICTSEEVEDRDNLRFIKKEDIISEVLKEREKEGKDIYLFGGGILIDSFIKEDIIDEYIIATIPTILGKGIPLFLKDNPKIDLKLKEYFVNDGIIVSKYIKR
ncbi:MAG: dihydrofolate reductase family protein [Clostridium sp.]